MMLRMFSYRRYDEMSDSWAIALKHESPVYQMGDTKPRF